ncbi:MAG: hypothetical protein HYS81_04240 [Candidatus Aenigmatarchaeota archaeon]|nr:MAG: hypothetical protein HYS81_04240 [Candidatus Aenigmarchaeota archaeon]
MEDAQELLRTIEKAEAPAKATDQRPPREKIYETIARHPWIRAGSCAKRADIQYHTVVNCLNALREEGLIEVRGDRRLRVYAVAGTLYIPEVRHEEDGSSWVDMKMPSSIKRRADDVMDHLESATPFEMLKTVFAETSSNGNTGMFKSALNSYDIIAKRSGTGSRVAIRVTRENEAELASLIDRFTTEYSVGRRDVGRMFGAAAMYEHNKILSEENKKRAAEKKLLAAEKNRNTKEVKVRIGLENYQGLHSLKVLEGRDLSDVVDSAIAAHLDMLISEKKRKAHQYDPGWP